MSEQDRMIALTYWEGLKNSEGIVRASDVDPIEIQSLLAESFILQQENNNQGSHGYRYVVTGSRFAARYRCDPQSQLFSALWPSSHDLDALDAMVSHVKQSGMPGGYQHLMVFDDDSLLPVDVLILPLEFAGNRAGQLIGYVSCGTTMNVLGDRECISHQDYRPMIEHVIENELTVGFSE